MEPENPLYYGYAQNCQNPTTSGFQFRQQTVTTVTRVQTDMPTSSQPPLTGSIMLRIAFTTKLEPAQTTTATTITACQL